MTGVPLDVKRWTGFANIWTSQCFRSTLIFAFIGNHQGDFILRYGNIAEKMVELLVKRVSRIMLTEPGLAGFFGSLTWWPATTLHCLPSVYRPVGA